MFAPDGYVSFADVCVNMELLSHSVIVRITGAAFREREVRGTIAQQMLRAGLIREACNAAFVRDFLEEYFLAKLLELHPPVLCSPTGTIMRVSEQFFIHADRLDWIYLRLPIDEMPELSGYFEFSKKIGFNGMSVRRRYCFVDAEFGTIKIKNNSHTLFDYCSHLTDDRGREMVDVINNFSGWSLCWKEEDLPSWLDLVKLIFPDSNNVWGWESYFNDNYDIHENSSQRILSDVLQAYPSGKTDKWEIVEKKVGYARRSIERALDATGRKDWKLAGGQD